MRVPNYFLKYEETGRSLFCENDYVELFEKFNVIDWKEFIDDLAMDKSYPYIIAKTTASTSLMEFYSVFFDMINPRSKELLSRAIESKLYAYLGDYENDLLLRKCKAIVNLLKILGWGLDSNIIVNGILFNDCVDIEIREDLLIALSMYNDPPEDEFWIEQIDIAKYPHLFFGRLNALKDTKPDKALEGYLILTQKPNNIESYILHTQIAVSRILEREEGWIFLNKILEKLPEWSKIFFNERIIIDSLKDKFILSLEEKHMLSITINRIIEREKTLLYIDKKFVKGVAYNKFVDNVRDSLKNILCNYIVNCKRGLGENISWDGLPQYAFEGKYDFLYDPYFLSESRQETGADVIELGYVNSITFYLSKNSDAWDVLVHCRALNKGLNETIIEILSKTHSQLGVLGGCMSTSEVNKIFGQNIGFESHLNIKWDIYELREWIDKDHLTNIIIGDIGLISLLEDIGDVELINKRGVIIRNSSKREDCNYKHSGNDPRTIFELDQKKYPAGLFFLRKDKIWKQYLWEACKEAIEALLEEKWDYELFSKELSNVGVVAFPLQELCGQFDLLDKFIEIETDKLKAKIEIETDKLNAKLGQAIVSQNFEEAEALKLEINKLSEIKISVTKSEQLITQKRLKEIAALQDEMEKLKEAKKVENKSKQQIPRKKIEDDEDLQNDIDTKKKHYKPR